MVQNSIFKFREIFKFSEFFSFSDIFIFREIFIFRTFLYLVKFLYSVKSLYARIFFKKIAVSKMLRSFLVEQPCWSPFEVHLQAILRTFLRLLLEKVTPQ